MRLALHCTALRYFLHLPPSHDATIPPQSKKSKVQHKKRKSCTFPSLLLIVQISSLTVLSASAGTSSRENVVKRFLSQIAFFYISFKLSWVLNRPGPQSSTSRTFSASHWLFQEIFRPIWSSSVLSHLQDKQFQEKGQEHQLPLSHTFANHICC